MPVKQEIKVRVAVETATKYLFSNRMKYRGKNRYSSPLEWGYNDMGLMSCNHH